MEKQRQIEAGRIAEQPGVFDALLCNKFGLQNSLKLQLQRIYLLLFFTGACPWEAHTHVHTDQSKASLFLTIPNQIILISSCVARLAMQSWTSITPEG